MSREIIHDDALRWLRNRKTPIPNIVTGICDMDEIDMTMDKYLEFFKTTASLIFTKMSKKGYAIFIQTDRKYNREWFDKSYMLTSIAIQHGFKTVWHKIVLHRDVDATDLHRPTYAHMLCYSKEGSTGIATPDVVPVSKKLYKNATPMEAAYRAIEFIAKTNKTDTTIIDPFVGQGTIPAIANSLGLDAVGIDIDIEQVKKAKIFSI